MTTSEEFHSLFDIKSYFFFPSHSLNIIYIYRSIFLTTYELQKKWKNKKETNKETCQYYQGSIILNSMSFPSWGQIDIISSWTYK